MKHIKFGWLSGFGMMVGVVGLGVCALSAIGILLGWKLSMSDVELPSDWGTLGGLCAACGLILILSVYGAFMRGKFQAAKGKPSVRIALVVIGVGLLVLAGRGVQVMALTMSYGSMLAYYSTDGDLEDVADELKGNPKPEHLDAAISRAAGYGNTGALKLLLDAGADFRQATEPEEHRRCVLGGHRVGVDFVKLAIERGATPETCPGSPDLIWQRVRHGDDDASVAEVVTLLRTAGWDPNAFPDYDKRPTLEMLKKRKKDWTKTAAALQ